LHANLQLPKHLTPFEIVDLPCYKDPVLLRMPLPSTLYLVPTPTISEANPQHTEDPAMLSQPSAPVSQPSALVSDSSHAAGNSVEEQFLHALDAVEAASAPVGQRQHTVRDQSIRFSKPVPHPPVLSQISQKPQFTSSPNMMPARSAIPRLVGEELPSGTLVNHGARSATLPSIRFASDQIDQAKESRVTPPGRPARAPVIAETGGKASPRRAATQPNIAYHDPPVSPPAVSVQKPLPSPVPYTTRMTAKPPLLSHKSAENITDYPAFTTDDQTSSASLCIPRRIHSRSPSDWTVHAFASSASSNDVDLPRNGDEPPPRPPPKPKFLQPME